MPYSGGAHGPSPLETRSPIMLYHSSLVLPPRSPITIMVMLSHPTPPVSLLDARQLSIMFSQIRCSSCFAAMPLRTNSTTACEDWQSQIPIQRQCLVHPQCVDNVPSQAMTKNSSSLEMSWVTTSGKAVTICCSGAKSAPFLNSKSPMARERARLPLTRPKSTKPPAALIRAFSPAEVSLLSGVTLT